MIKLYKNLYKDDKVIMDVDEILEKIKNKRYLFGVYFVMLASNEHNLLDIINANEMIFNHYHNRNNYVIGIAQSREDAIGLATKIIMEVFYDTGDYKIREYYNKGSFGNA